MRRNKKNDWNAPAIMLMMGFLLILSGCGRKDAAPEPAEPLIRQEANSPVETAAPSEAEIIIGRQDGERFEEIILLEGMEEKVRYEHIRNDTVGIEMDYDYESFARQSAEGRERFVSVWDDPENPGNWLELTASAESAESVAASVGEALSREYDIIQEPITLEHAGSCIRIEASERKGTGMMADQLQVVTVIPAPDGCRVAAEHFSIESAEGFGRRFSYMLNTLTVIDRRDTGGT